MPLCKLCKERIDLSKTGERAFHCEKCGGSVCLDHFECGRALCHECAGLPVHTKKRSFIRKPKI